MFRRVFLLLASLIAFGSGSAAAQVYPNKPIRIIVGFAPGGGADITARTIGQKLQEALGQPVVVDNRPGAGGTIGAATVAKAPADGYTLVMTTNGPHAIAPSLYPTLPYDILEDFAPISQITVTPYVLVVHPSLEVSSVPQLLSLLRSRPQPESYASAGIGTPAHLAAVLFGSMTGIALNHVPYKGAAPGLVAVLGGEVRMMFSEASVASTHIKSGKIRPLAVTGLRRSALLPDLATLDEAGLAGYETTVWQALMAPAGTPPEIVNRLNAEIRKILALPDIQERFSSLGAIISPTSPEELREIMRHDQAKWAKLIKDAGVKLE